YRTRCRENAGAGTSQLVLTRRDGEDDDVVEVAARGGIERAATGDDGDSADAVLVEDLAVGQLRLAVGPYPGDREADQTRPTILAISVRFRERLAGAVGVDLVPRIESSDRGHRSGDAPVVDVPSENRRPAPGAGLGAVPPPADLGRILGYDEFAVRGGADRD